MSVGGLVLAGGRGARAGLGRNKALVEVDGASLLARSVDALVPHVDVLVVVVRSGDVAAARRLVGGRVAAVVAGGATRHASEVAGLAVLDDDVELVAVHDAARPLVTAEVVRSAQAACASATAGVPGVPRAVPLARPTGGGAAVLLERQGVVGVQTPQVVRADALRQAFAASREDDPATLLDTVEPLLRHDPLATVLCTPGDPANLKITWSDDLARAVALLDGSADPAPTLRRGRDRPGIGRAVHVDGVRAVADALRRVDAGRVVVGALDRTGLVDVVGSVHAGPGVLDEALAARDLGAAVERAVADGAILTLAGEGIG